MQIILWLAIASVNIVLAVLVAEDWQHLLRPKRHVVATVIGFRSELDDGTRSFTPRLSFTDETGKAVEVVDKVYSTVRTPPEGRHVALVYPAGRPDMARVPRPWLRVLIYGVAGYMLVVLTLVMMGKIS